MTVLISLIIAIPVCVGVVWLFHRICTRLEDAGYLYYRKHKGGGSAANAFAELDKLTRPSIEHVMEVEDTAKIDWDDVGGE